MTDDLDKLEQVARAATQGEWQWDDDDGSFGSRRARCYTRIAVAAPVGEWCSSIIIGAEDVAFIVAFQPSVVLRLIARVRELEQRQGAGGADDVD